MRGAVVVSYSTTRVGGWGTKITTSTSANGNGSSPGNDARYALNVTAFVVAAGAVLLRFGGRAALVSTLGLDFASENPELRDGLENVLNYANSIGTGYELLLFVFAWTLVKVFCFDAGGVVLALSSGILFGGVLQGALLSSLSATIGSSVAFGLAKLDTPFRDKALEVVDRYPSLRGIEKVVARDGLKAILTLRLAPVLPIPIGLYNYVYGVTNVPYIEFAGGIFLGSMKPYLLDSYLGVFGKQIVDGDAGGGGMEDALLLIALGVSVLIGVFASQLANETWDSINKEIDIDKAERKKRAMVEGGDDDDHDDDVVREFMGVGLPQWMIGFQLSLMAANKRVNAMIEDEYRARVWNYTMEEVIESSNGIIDPASRPDSPEIVGANTGFDFGASVCDGLVLSPALLVAFLKYTDPLYDADEESPRASVEFGVTGVGQEVSAVALGPNDEMFALPSVITMEPEEAIPSGPARQQRRSHAATADDLLTTLRALRARLQKEIDIL
ncbi:hypothetical protein ACHAXA_001564 [Cyclostephanos tholiformis]|uniref:VTT domain-containing protein n=1 Tax=Cyclostephanos tholiformis TaxID=382380 RepID=A0ABD3RRL4_9STRA